MKNVLGDNIGFVELVDSMGNDLSIIRSARVSYGKTSNEFGDREKKLIKYLVKNSHTSPLESVNFTFNVKAPLYIARQWMRHRTWSYNEISRRYTSENIEFHIPREFRTQSKDNKQMSDGNLLNSDLSEKYTDTIKEFCKTSLALYNSMIDSGVAREIARGIIPQYMYTSFYATTDLHNLLHFLKLRRHPHAQEEMRRYAFAIENIIKEVVPFTYQAWEENIKEKYAEE